MHELAVTEHILEMAIRYAVEAKAARITDLYLVVGDLSSIVDDSIQLYWDFLARETMAAGARLHFRRVPAEMTCRSCDQSYSPRDSLLCPLCGGSNVRITAGEEFYLEAIDVDQRPTPRGPQEFIYETASAHR